MTNLYILWTILNEFINFIREMSWTSRFKLRMYNFDLLRNLIFILFDSWRGTDRPKSFIFLQFLCYFPITGCWKETPSLWYFHLHICIFGYISSIHLPIIKGPCFIWTIISLIYETFAKIWPVIIFKVLENFTISYAPLDLYAD